MKTDARKIKLLIFLVSIVVGGVLFSERNALSANDCVPNRVTIPGNQIGGHIELSSGQSVPVVAEFSGNCAGRRAEFRICYQTGSACEAVENSNTLGNQAITDRRATLQWTAQKNPRNAQRAQSIGVWELSGSILRQSLPIVVFDQNEETECRLRGLTAAISSGRANLTATTNSRCGGRDVYFLICSQNTRGVQDCSTNFGQAKASGGTVKISNPIPSAFSGNTSIFFRASIGDQTVDSKILSNQDFIGGVGIDGGESISFNFKLKNYLIGDPKDISGVANIIGRFIFNLGIPLAVIVIIYGGLRMLTSGGKLENYKEGLSALKYASLGLAILLIGKGFVSLVQSILSIK